MRQKLTFVLLNNLFYPMRHEQLLKFDLKGTFSPGSAVQYDQTQDWYQGPMTQAETTYREFDFMGIDRKPRHIEGFFPEGILIEDEKYKQFSKALKQDVEVGFFPLFYP